MNTMLEAINNIYGGIENMDIFDKDEMIQKNTTCKVSHISEDSTYDLPQVKKKSIRRKNDIRKAIRKRKITANIYHTGYYDNLHQYSKNKIHCSCPICAFNHKKLGYKNRTFKELKQIEDMDFQENDFTEEDLFEAV